MENKERENLDVDKLITNSRIFDIDGVNMIGNIHNGSIIGLDLKSKIFIEKLISKEFNIDNLITEQKDLINELVKCSFFEDFRPSIDRSYIHITSHCNLDCYGCYSYENKRNLKPDLSFSEIKVILQNLKKSGLKHLVISGGEPFINKDIIEIIKYAKNDLEIELVDCISNGTVELEKYIEASKYLDTLFFSLDTYNENESTLRPKNVFNLVLNKTNQLKDYDVEVNLIFTIHKNNYMCVNNFEELVNSLDVAHNYSILTVKEKDCCNSNKHLMLNKKELAEFENLCKPYSNVDYLDKFKCRISCGAGKSLVSIASNGDVYPCHMYTYENDFLMGNAIKDDIRDILNNSIISKTNVDDIKICNKCEIKYICGGACRYAGYCITGDVLSPDTRYCSQRISGIKNIIKDLTT